MSTNGNTVNVKRLFLSDDPIGGEGQDAFGHKALVDALHECISTCDFKINIGLFGQWGVGKTSIVELLRDRLKGNDNITLFMFDAWKHSSGSLSHELILELNRTSKKFNQRELESKIYDIYEGLPYLWWKRTFRWIKNAFSSFIWAVAVTIILYVALEALYRSGGISDAWMSSLRVAVFVPVIVAVFKEIATLKIDVGKASILPAKSNPTKLRSIFSQIIAKTVGKDKANKKRVVIVVDNLDRCSGEAAIEMLGAIKNLMEHKKCIYIFPCDRDAMLTHLRKQRDYSQAEATEYLRKFFQTSFVVPPFKPQDLEKYTKQLMSGLQTDFGSDVSEVITSAFQENPRSIKQFLNNLTTQYMLARNREVMRIVPEGKITGNTGFLAKLLVIRQEYSDFYTELEKRHDLLDMAEECFRNEGKCEHTDTIEPMFKKEPGLEEFLRGTRLFSDEDASVFLLLNKEIYPSSISDAEEFKRNVNNGVVDYVLKNLNELKDDNDVTEYVNRIANLTEENQRYRRKQSTFNGTDILIKVHHLLPESHKRTLANRIGILATLGELRSEIGKYDVGLVFPVIGDMDETFQGRMLEVYVGVITPGNVDFQVIERLIEMSELVTQTARDIFNEKVRGLSTGDRDAAEKLIRMVSESSIASSNLIAEDTADHFEKAIQVSADDANKGNIDLYLLLRKRASVETRRDFIGKILSVVSINENDSFDEEKQFGVNMLLNLDAEDLPREVAGDVFDVLSKFAGLVSAPTGKIEFIRVFFKFSISFEREQQREFTDSQVVEFVSSADRDTLVKILDLANEYSVAVLKNRPVLDAYLQRVQSDLPNTNLVVAIAKNTDRRGKQKVKNVLLELIGNPDDQYSQVGLESIERLHSEFKASENGELCDACLRKLEDGSVADPDKHRFITPVLAAFKSNVMPARSVFAGYIVRMKDSISPEHREPTLEGMIDIMEQRARDRDFNEYDELVLQSVISDQSVLSRGDTDRLVEALLELSDKRASGESRLSGIRHLGEMRVLYHQKQYVKNRLLEDSKSPDSDISAMARRALVALGFSRQVSRRNRGKRRN